MDNNYTNTDIFKSTECPSDALLLMYVKDKITKEDKRALELHMVDCEMCNDMVEGYQRMNQADIDANIKAIEQKIDIAVKAHSKTEKAVAKFNWYYAAAALVLIALTGILYQFYFSSLNDTNVADLPKPHEQTTEPAAETKPIVEETLAIEPPKIEATKFTKPVISAETEEQNLIIQDYENADSRALEAPAPVGVKEDVADDKIAVTEMTTKQLNTVAIGNTDAAATPQNFSNSGANTIIAQPSTTNFSSAPANIETLNLSKIEGEQIVFKWNSTEEKNAKSKAKSPAQTAKKSEAKDKAETDSEKGAAVAEPDLLSEALNLMKQKQYTTAIQKFNEHLTKHPLDCEAANGLATSYEFINQQTEAIATYTKLAELKCARIADQAYLKLAALYLKNNQLAEAKTALQKARLSKYNDIAEQAQKELDKL